MVIPSEFVEQMGIPIRGMTVMNMRNLQQVYLKEKHTINPFGRIFSGVRQWFL